MMPIERLDAQAITRGIRDGAFTAQAVTRATLDRIERLDPAINAFTAVLADEAMAASRVIDDRRAGGDDPGPLAGVPFSVKNLFDIGGLTTLAGSKINRDLPPASADAVLVRRLKAAGAVLIGANNMDEYAYGFTTENAHAGPCHNPHDLARVAGGSSGGSAAAVAAGMVPISLGSDTNGSIRVPASFCGIFGLKPTFGRLPRTGTYPFVHSLDHLGPFARSVADLALAYDLMQGADPRDPACASRPATPSLPGLDEPPQRLRVATLAGFFRDGASPEMLAAVEAVAAALGSRGAIELPEARRARAAAFCMTAAEGGALHLSDLKRRPADFDPGTRSRLLAGALLPAAVVEQAQRFRRWYQQQVLEIFRGVDILLAPATPDVAPLIGQSMMRLGSATLPTRPNIGIFTQPISFIGLPVVTVPVQRPGALPLGVQIIAAPWQEALALRVASWLERRGVVSAPIAEGPYA